MEDNSLERECVDILPVRLETSATWFSPVIVVNPHIVIALNVANFGGEQMAQALGMAGTMVEFT